MTYKPNKILLIPAPIAIGFMITTTSALNVSAEFSPTEPFQIALYFQMLPTLET